MDHPTTDNVGRTAYKGHDTSKSEQTAPFHTSTSNQTSQGLHHGECWRASRFWRTAAHACVPSFFLNRTCVPSLLSRSEACFRLRAERQKTGGHRATLFHDGACPASGWQSCSHTLATVIRESCFYYCKDICGQSACDSRVTPFW
jgi:hypothetical protein